MRLHHTRPQRFLKLLLVGALLPLNLAPVWAVKAPPAELSQIATPADLPAELTSNEVEKLLAGDGAAGDILGYNVAISGDTAVVGAERDSDLGLYSGSAYVFRDNGTAWVLEQKLTASDGSAGDYFGRSVGIEGDTIVVGAYQDDVGVSDCGSAYVFTRTGTSWTEQAKLYASDRATGDSFSRQGVAVSGNTVLVAAHNDDSSQGSAYVFTGSGTEWTQQAKLVAPNRGDSDYFGQSITIENDTAIVGANYDDDLGTNAGAAYVFTRSGTAWSNEATLTASDAAAGDSFGGAATLSGDTVVIGAYLVDDGAYTNCGAGYVFTRSGTTWTQQAKLLASDRAGSEYFGYSAALQGDTVVIGAYNDTVGAVSFCGSAYVFTRDGTEWTEQMHLTASDAAEGDYLGRSVGLSAGTVIAGAYADDDNGAEAGAAYLFDATRNQAPVAADDPGAMSAVTQALADDGAAGDWFGVDADISSDTAIVGSYGDDDDGSLSGAAYVFVKNGTTWVQQAKLVADDAEIHSWFGHSVAIEGDTAIVGAPMADSPAGDAGAIYVFTRTGDSWSQAAKLAGDGATDSRFGYAVDLSGDTLVSGSGSDAGWYGAAYVFTGGGASWTRQAKLTASDGQYADEMGNAVALDGDVLVMGARGDDDVAYDAGAAYVFTRDEGIWSQTDKVVASNGAYMGYFGDSVDVSGNTALVGWAKGNAAYVYTPSGADWSEQASLVATDATGEENLGQAVALDGTTAVVGAYTDWANAQFSGSAYLFEGAGAEWTQTRKLSVADGAYNDQYGISVALDAGRVVVGAYYDDNAGGADAGSVYIYSEGAYEVDEDEQLTVAAAGLLANDADADGDSLEATLVAGPAHGTLDLAADGSFTFDPAADYSGPDSFTYKANDGRADSNVATATIFVTPVNDAPVAVADSYSVAEDGTLNPTAPGVLANDTDIDGDSLEATVVAEPAHGTLDLDADGSFTYEPDDDYNGPDSFTYKANDGTVDSNVVTVTLTVTSVNDAAPVAVADSYTVPEDGKLSRSASGVLANDTDVDGDDLTAVLAKGPLHGTLKLNANGSFTYEPAADYNGSDSFTYKANDGTADSNVAVVTITVTPVDDALQVVPIAGSDRYRTAVEASLEAYPDGAGTVVIATGVNWPDALGGAALAGAVDGPLLLTKPGELPGAVVSEITRLKAKNAYILGGTAAVSQAVQDALEAKLSGTVTRIAGPNRYGTANQVADAVIRIQGADYTGDAFIATGDNFPDALGASPLAASSATPILLAKRNGTPYLPSKVDSAVILGGAAAVTPVTEAAVRRALGTSKVTRVGGTDRYDTAAKVADYGVAHGMHWDGVGVATGLEFPDALSGGAMLGQMDSVLLLTKQTSLVAAARQRLTANKNSIDNVYFIGGTAAVSQSVRDDVTKLIE